jgi:uncharacterized protein
MEPRERLDVPAQIHLEPVAAPSILGLYGYAGATFIVATYLAGWYGDARTSVLIFPFAAMVGGLAQFTAGMWAFKARDGAATAMHGVWGASWLAYGILAILFATGVAAPADLAPAIGYYFVALAFFSWVAAYAASAENAATAVSWAVAALGASCAAIAGWAGSAAWTYLAAWIFIVSSVVSWYAGSALMLENAFGRVVLPLGEPKSHAERARVEFGIGEPGVIRGQA